ncbi:MAG: tyrosine-type recombinase/integrase [Gammaproteobacteria bacterium]|nr:tyrosine-type recombinase/integrase [Gammaproteobacteria bacterium]
MVIRPLYLDDPSEFELAAYPLFADSGWNRAGSEPIIHASNDAQAVQEFLDHLREKSETTRATYAKEIERLLLWCIHEAGQTVTALKETDFRRYRRFMLKPPKRWCDSVRKKNQRRRRDGELNPDWRPFAGALSENSVAKAERALSSFFGYLTKKRYADVNPMPRITRQERPRFRDRHLPRETLVRALAILQERDRVTGDPGVNNAQLRACFLLQLYFYLGLRLSEAANHRMGHFYCEKDHGDDIWFLRVTGKGNKIRDIPVPDAFLRILAEFRGRLGLRTQLPTIGESTALVPKLNKDGSFDSVTPVTARRVSTIVQDAFNKAAALLEARNQRDDAEHAARLRQASSHWVRHTYGTSMVDSGMPLTDVRDNLGHASVVTTEIYLHDDQRERHRRSRSHKLG